MKYAIILSLAGSSLALPFGNANDAALSTNLEARHYPKPGPGSPDDGAPTIPNLPGGAPAPDDGAPSKPQPSGGFSLPGPPPSRRLAIDYQLAPGSPHIYKRQELPEFTPLPGSPTPPTPTGGLPMPGTPAPTGGPSVPMPTGGLPTPGKPDTPGLPPNDEEGGDSGDSGSWWDWVKDKFGNKGGNGE